MKVWKYDNSQLKKININLEEHIKMFDNKIIDKLKHKIMEDFKEKVESIKRDNNTLSTAFGTFINKIDEIKENLKNDIIDENKNDNLSDLD